MWTEILLLLSLTSEIVSIYSPGIGTSVGDGKYRFECRITNYETIELKLSNNKNISVIEFFNCLNDGTNFDTEPSKLSPSELIHLINSYDGNVNPDKMITLDTPIFVSETSRTAFFIKTDEDCSSITDRLQLENIENLKRLEIIVSTEQYTRCDSCFGLTLPDLSKL